MKERFNMIGPSESISRVLLASKIQFNKHFNMVIKVEIFKIRNLQEYLMSQIAKLKTYKTKTSVFLR